MLLRLHVSDTSPTEPHFCVLVTRFTTNPPKYQNRKSSYHLEVDSVISFDMNFQKKTPSAAKILVSLFEQIHILLLRTFLLTSCQR